MNIKYEDDIKESILKSIRKLPLLGNSFLITNAIVFINK